MDRFTERSAETRRLFHLLEHHTKTQKILIFAVIGLAVFDPTMAFILAPFFILQMRAVVVKIRLRRQLDRASLATEFYRRAVKRIENHWIGDGNTGAQYLGADEVFADDLNLFGNGSLFQFLCASQTSIGDNMLAAWLTQPANADEIRERQSAVREMSNNLDLREQLAVLPLDRGKFQPQAVAEWTSAPELLPSRIARATAFALAVAFASVILSFFGGFGPGVGITILIVILELAFYTLFRSRLRSIRSHAKSVHATLIYLSLVQTVLQKSSFESRHLSNIRCMIAAGAVMPPWRVCAVYRFLMHEPLLAILLHQFVPSVDRWRRACAQPADAGLLALGELEAISSLAQYSFIRPEATFPTVVDTEKCFEAIGLAHPLVGADQRVENDLQLNSTSQLLLVSGSNMSGKSTMLRTVGVNAVLALCGAPVCAKQLRISPFSIGTAMRFQDSLDNRTSHFYAVIVRLRRVMDLQEGKRPLLFLIDEILQGTNSHDRIRGAEAVVRKLIERGGVGLITTHDLELTRIADTLGGRAANVHFADTLMNGEIRFDYKMRPGVVESRNALTLMRKMRLID